MTRKRILIVDDEIGSTWLLKANLELTNRYEVQVENRPENTIKIAREFKPDAVLLDMVMPQMLGTTVAKAILGDPELKSVLIAFLTAADNRILPPVVDPTLDRLPRIYKPATMESILQFLEQNLSLPPVSGLAVPDMATQPHGGNNE